MITDGNDITRLKQQNFGYRQGGASNNNIEGYPEIKTLDAGTCITIADIEGPAVITNIHSCQIIFIDDNNFTGFFLEVRVKPVGLGFQPNDDITQFNTKGHFISSP